MSIRFLRTVTLAITILISIVACKDDTSSETGETKKKKRPFGWVRNIIGSFSSQDTIFLDSGYVDKFLAKYPKFKPFQPEIRKFYTDRKNAYAWYDGGGIIEPSANLYNRIKNMKYDGLQDSLPYQERFDDLMDRPNRKGNKEELEVMLTSQYFALANYVWKGLDEEDIKKLGWHIPRKKLSYTAFLDSMLNDSGDFLEAEPVNQQYEALRAQLKRYKELESKASTLKPIAMAKGRKKYEPGDSSAIIAQVRQRLALFGDLSEDNGQSMYDASLEPAVRAFQKRHGLQEDGVIGKSMIDELNVPIQSRIDQIVVNMERSRWMPLNNDSTGNYLLVNIPEFKLHVYENNRPAWESNVVVGERENKTVVFSGTLKYVVFSPHWNVPESIVQNEIMPAIDKDPGYLEKQDLEITGERNGLPVVRQKPGTENALGLVKFMFPNTHNIYLHDSPAKELFNRTERAFSHGCVRVGEPVRLAEYLLRDDPTWNAGKITEAMNGGEEKYVNLKTRVPVYIVYFTSWVDNEGKINFRKDIYDNDSRLARMILDKGSVGSVASNK